MSASSVFRVTECKSKVKGYRGRTNEGHTTEDISKKHDMAIKISAPWVFRRMMLKWARGAAHRYSARALKLLFLERVRTGAFAHLQNSSCVKTLPGTVSDKKLMG